MGGGGSRPQAENTEILGGATFYIHSNFRMDNNERGRKFTHGNYPIVPHDTYTSAKIAPGCRVIMYEHDNFRGKAVTKPDNNVTVNETRLNDLGSIDMDDKISSLKVQCDEGEYCRQNPLVREIDCRPHCPPGTACNVTLAQYCSKNLNTKTECREFCMDPSNNCDDEDVENYCKQKQTRIGAIPQECQCILWPPLNDLERLIDSGNGGVYENNNQIRKGNYACWSPKCKDGTSPQQGQLHLSRWWNYIDACTPITICNTDLGDSNLSLYDRSTFVINNNCGANTPSATNLLSSGTETAPDVLTEATETETDNTEAQGFTLDRKQSLLLGLFIFVFVALTLKRSQKIKKALQRSGIEI